MVQQGCQVLVVSAATNLFRVLQVATDLSSCCKVSRFNDSGKSGHALDYGKRCYYKSILKRIFSIFYLYFTV
jgi:hypothetical protein